MSKVRGRGEKGVASFGGSDSCQVLMPQSGSHGIWAEQDIFSGSALCRGRETVQAFRAQRIVNSQVLLEGEEGRGGRIVMWPQP